MGDQRPVVCIDQCDARAYCAWSKQRLCGRAGGGVLDVSQDESQDMLSKAEGSHADPSQSQWYGACSTGEVSTYPYGDGYVAGRCVDNSVASRVQDVGSRAECMGGYAGLFDMSGNAEEWEDACTQFTTPPLLQNCLVRGGSVDHPGSGQLRPGELPLLACAASRGLAQGFIYTTVGFRCCADD
jgi:formylglycine-generating enzyme required for sulfatase activity